MATIIDELMISLGIDSSKAKTGMSEATNAIQGGVSKITSALGGLTAAFAGMYSIGSAFSEYLSAADSMGKFSDALGVNIEDMHAWSEAAKRSGGSIEGFQGSVKSLTTQLSKMATTGNSRAGKMLAAVGIDPGEIGRQRDSFEVMMEIADKMQGMSKAEAMGFGSALGLDSGTIMLLQQGRDGVASLVQKQKELGVYTKEDARVTAEFNDAIDDSKQSFMGLAAIVLRAVVPALKKVVEWATKFVSYLRKHQTAVKAFFVMVAALITGLLLPAVVSFMTALLANPITWVILALAALAAVIEDLIVWLEGGDSALEDFWTELFGSREDAKKTFEEIKEAVQKFVDESIPKLIEFKDDIKEMIQTVKELWDELSNSTPWKILNHNILESRREQANAMQEMEEDVKRLTGGVIENNYGGGGGGGFEADPIGDSIKSAIESAREEVNNTWEWVNNQASEAITSVTDAIAGVWKDFTDTLSEVWETVIETVTDVLEGFLKTGETVLKAVSKAWEDFKNTAIDAINSLQGPIASLADAIRTNLIGAIDDASARWQAFQQEIALGNAAIAASAADYSRGGGSYSNTNNTEWNVTLNGVQNGQQAASDFRSGVGSRFSGTQANAGVW